MTYEIVRAYCGWPSRDALKHGVPGLDAFPAGWRTLVVRRGRKWTTILDPFTLQKEKVKNSRLERVTFEPASIGKEALARILSSRIHLLDKRGDAFLKGLIQSLSAERTSGDETIV